MAMATPRLPLFLVLLVLCFCQISGYSTEIPAYPTVDSAICEPHESSARSHGIIDITHEMRPDLPQFGSEDGIGSVTDVLSSIANGSDYNHSFMKMSAHTGTHVDAPSHFYQHYFDSGVHVNTLDLHILNGPALLVDVSRDTNITAEAMKSLNIPKGVERVLFRTLNTDRRLMWKTAIDSSFVGFTEDGAQWLKDNTNIKLIGVDYLSAASFDYLFSSHLVLLKDNDIILVEGLNLDDVDVGLYTLHCLPLKLRADGSPIRCILEK